MTLRFVGNLVGMRHRPPASDVTNLLPAGVELLLVRQPDNPYDINACAIQLLGFCVGGQHEHLYTQFKNALLEGQELNYTEDHLTDPLHLGYLCNSDKTGGKIADLVSEQLDSMLVSSWPCKLTFDMKGSPQVEVEITPQPVREDAVPSDA